MHNDFPSDPGVKLQLFARRHGGDYVMRSERRGQYGASGSPEGSNHHNKKKKKRAGALYILLAVLLSVVLWPIGMILLWRRKLRWKVTTKLLASIVCLALCAAMCIFALTYQTSNPDITRAQDSVNDFLDNASVHIGDFYQDICDRAVVAYRTALDLNDALTRASLKSTADGLDLAVKGADSLNRLIGKTQDAPVASDAPTEAPVEATDAPEAAETPVPTPTWPPEETDAPEETAVPDATDAPVESLAEEPTEAPTEAPTEQPTPEPTATPVVSTDLKPKPAAEAVVYYNAGGKRYHMAETCRGMKSAKPGTLGAAVSENYQKCDSCNSPDPSILEQADVVWLDENNLFHLTDECVNFTGKWSLATLDDALTNGYYPCTTCKAGLYMAVRGQTADTQTAEAGAAPAETVEPSPEVITPDFALKPAGDALVYHSPNGGWYHSIDNCKGMSGASQYPLSECVDHYKWCRRCEPPKPELVNEKCLWQDENSLCHTTDECPNFIGKYKLIPRDDALDAGLSGCLLCGANRYLIPNTTINYIAE